MQSATQGLTQGSFHPTRLHLQIVVRVWRGCVRLVMVRMVGCSTRPSSCGNKHRRFRNSNNKHRERETLARIHAQLQHRVHLLTLSRAEATSIPNLALVLQGVGHWASGTALLGRYPLLQQSRKLVPIRPRRVIILYAPVSVLSDRPPESLHCSLVSSTTLHNK
jgi:hypothetical protein